MHIKTMKAARFHEYGEIDVIRYEDTSIPEIGDDELLIQVAATALNPADRLIVSGAARHLIPLSLPHTVGLDVSGIVVRTGKSVTHFHAGDRVYTFQYFDRDGGAAEYVACPAAHVSRAPASIPLCEIGALPAVALTAWQALFVHGDLQAGQRVLITAAAGGVGTIAVQLAKWKGAHVVGTASDRNEELLRRLGVDEIINYKKTSPRAALTTPLDLIFNLSPVDTSQVNELLTLLKPGGMLVSGTTPADGSEAERLGVRTLRMSTEPNAEQLARMANLVDDGLVKPCIAERFALKDVGDAFKMLGKTHGGKILLVVNDQL